MTKAYKVYDDYEDVDIFAFADSEKSAKEIFYLAMYQEEYEGEDFKIERVPELDYLNHEDGYLMRPDNSNEDLIALLKISVTCNYPWLMDNYCEYCDDYEECLERIEEEKEYEK